MLAVADVCAINALFAAPERLDRKVGTKVFRLRGEDEAWRAIRLVLSRPTRTPPRASSFWPGRGT
jgi:hypothetical protein